MCGLVVRVLRCINEVSSLALQKLGVAIVSRLLRVSFGRTLISSYAELILFGYNVFKKVGFSCGKQHLCEI